jgi:hypothetical protein
MKAIMLALVFVAPLSLVGCSQNAELERVRAERDAAKAELAQVKAELDLLKAQLAGLAEKQNKSPANPEEAVRKAVQAFLSELASLFPRSAYESMSAAFKMRVDRTAFEQFIEQHHGLTAGVQEGAFCPMKIRKLDKDNIYECDCITSHLKGNVFVCHFTLRLVQDDGAWKIDELVEYKDRLQ